MKKIVTILKANKKARDGRVYSLYDFERIIQNFESGLIVLNCEGNDISRIWIEEDMLLGEFEEIMSITHYPKG